MPIDSSKGLSERLHQVVEEKMEGTERGSMD